VAGSKENGDSRNNSGQSGSIRGSRKLKVKDNEVIKAVEEMKRAEVKMLRDKE